MLEVRVNHSSKLGNPCPVCAGWVEMPQGQSTRCHGFTKGYLVYCTREEFSGELAPGQCHYVRPGYECNCGQEHDNQTGHVIDPIRIQKSTRRKSREMHKLMRQISSSVEPILNTPGEEYLASRSILLDHYHPPDLDFLLEHQLKYHPGSSWSGSVRPAVVANIRDGFGTLQGLHLIFLNGIKKADIQPNKISIGTIANNAMFLARSSKSPEPYTLNLVSGLEDGLSVQQMSGIPTMAVPGDFNLYSVNFDELTAKVYLYGDGDETGRTETLKAKDILETKEIEVIRRIFPDGKDANETLINGERLPGVAFDSGKSSST